MIRDMTWRKSRRLAYAAMAFGVVAGFAIGYRLPPPVPVAEQVRRPQ